jgi:hypothetical protein
MVHDGVVHAATPFDFEMAHDLTGTSLEQAHLKIRDPFSWGKSSSVVLTSQHSMYLIISSRICKCVNENTF